MCYFNRHVKQSNGTSAVTGTDWTGNGASTVNNRGVIRFPGTIAGSRFNNGGMSLGDTNTLTGPIIYNSSSLTSLRKRVSVPLSGGNFATMTAGAYVMRKVTTTLAGVANTSLLTGASDYSIRRSIHKKTSFRSTFLSSVVWAVSHASIETPGKNSPVYTLVYTTTTYAGTGNAMAFQNNAATNPASQGSVDIAAEVTPTSANNQFVYQFGSTVVYKDIFDARNEW